MAQHDLVGAHGRQPEVAVEGGDAQDLGRAVAGARSYMVDDLLGEVSVDGLSPLQDHDQAGGVLLILAQDAFHQGEVDA